MAGNDYSKNIFISDISFFHPFRTFSKAGVSPCHSGTPALIWAEWNFTRKMAIWVCLKMGKWGYPQPSSILGGCSIFGTSHFMGIPS